MNIAHLIPDLGLGGAEKYVLNLFQRSDKEQFHQKIIYWSGRQELVEDIAFDKEDIIKLNIGRIPSVETIFRLAQFLKRSKIDILHTHLIDADLMGFFASLILWIPQLITIHSYPFPTERRHCFRYKVMSLFKTDLLFVSNRVKAFVLSRTGISPNKTHVVHTGIDLQRYCIKQSQQNKEGLRNSLSIDSRSKIVGNVSRLIDGKGHRHLLMAAVEILRDFPNTMFLIVGDGELRDELIGLSNSLGISEHVRFTGSRMDIPELLDIMDIFLFPAYDEAFGISALEAMAMGKPIIATNDAAVPELITNREEGILIEPKDPKLISVSVQDLLVNPEECVRMGIAARNRSRLFSIERMVADIEEIYLKISRNKTPQDRENSSG